MTRSGERLDRLRLNRAGEPGGGGGGQRSEVLMGSAACLGSWSKPQPRLICFPAEVMMAGSSYVPSPPSICDLSENFPRNSKFEKLKVDP
jgi:hypothetical protein